MKKLLTMVALTLPLFAVAQHVTESPMSLKKRFSFLFGGKSAVMIMTLQRDYEVGATDTLYSFMVAVTETEVEVSNVSIGFSSFLTGGGVADAIGGLVSSTSATLNKESRNGIVSLDKANFMKFYKCVNDVYKVAGTMAVLKKKIDALCTCGVEGIRFGGEYLPGGLGLDQRFFFELGVASFSMTRLEFEEIVKFVRDVKNVFETK